MLRYKGVLYVEDAPNRYLFQGVHGMIATNEDRPWKDNEIRKSQLVFIGRHIPKQVLQDGLSLCVAADKSLLS